MSFSDCIISALGLQDVVLEKVVEHRAELRLEVHVRQIREQSCCHFCGFSLWQVHEWKPRRILAPPLGAFLRVEITLYQLRGPCLHCNAGVRSARVEFVHPQFQNMTLALCELAGRLMEEMPCEAVARYLGLNSKTLWDLDQWRMRAMKPLLQLPKDLDLEKMSADEVHFRTLPKTNSWKRPEVEFITNLVCYKESKVLANAPGRDEDALIACLRTLSKVQRARIKSFAVDLHDGFINAVGRLCPNASINADRFHLAELANKAFDFVRKQEFQRAREAGDDFQTGMLMPHRRFVFMEREKKLSARDAKMLDRIKELNRNILNAMILLEHFHRVLDKFDVHEFRKSLTLWYRMVRESRLKPFRTLAKTIRRYRQLIENYIQSKLTTAVSEGLNNKIKVLKRMGYGYQNRDSFQLKILQRCGFLNSRYIRTNSWFWSLPTQLAQNPPF